jgi:CRISPR/Cas system-associated exonuclease Cas4 (RecB family)
MQDNKKYPEFSWSLSRHKTLLDCTRRYAFSYYWSSGGWQKGASNLSKQIYRLKKLQNLNMLFGSSVHDQIHRIVEELDDPNKMPTEKQVISNVRSDLNQAYQDSKYRQGLWYENPGDYTMLSEIYYNNELPLEVISDFQVKLPTTAQNLLACSTVQDLFHRRKNIEIVAAERFRCMIVNGIKIWTVMDLVYRDLESKKWVIVDFKTGKRSSEDRTQLMLYGKFIAESFKLDSLDQIELRNEYLLDGTSVSYVPKAIDFSNVDYLLNTSMERMHAYMVDEANNIPREIEAFEQTENKAICRNCNYREVCGRV